MAKTLLNLGCGNRIITRKTWDVINHDRAKHRSEIDVCWDLDVLPWPWIDEQFDQVEAWAVLEHLRLSLLESMVEIWRITKPSGVLRAKVPYWKAEESYEDPTHRWFFAPGAFDVFDPSTKRGREYLFYTPYKWRIVERHMVNDPPTSISVVLEKVTRWPT